jgi:hypothetical protein
MRRQSRFATTSLLVNWIWLWSTLLAASNASAQNALPTADQLDQLLAPIALFPDALVAQICAASTDPQQILDANAWLHQNLTLTGQARTDAAQAQGFDPAFIALMNFAQVLDMMAQNIDDYAAIGEAFKADQGNVMDSIQRLRQQAYAAGALQSNEQQTIDVQGQGASQVVVIQPANPQVIYVPQYNPQVVFAQPGTLVAAPVITFGAGVALGAWMTDATRPWGWGGWGWNWGRRSVIVNHNPWVVRNRYRPRFPSYRFRPPRYGRPIYARPPNNWRDRPFYRPPGGRPPQFRPPSSRPPVSRPPASRPPASRPPVTGPGGARPPSTTSRGRQFRPNPYAGFPNSPGADRGASGGRRTAFEGSNNAEVSRAARNRGRGSVASEQRQAEGARRR